MINRLFLLSLHTHQCGPNSQSLPTTEMFLLKKKKSNFSEAIGPLVTSSFRDVRRCSSKNKGKLVADELGDCKAVHRPRRHTHTLLWCQQSQEIKKKHCCVFLFFHHGRYITKVAAVAVAAAAAVEGEEVYVCVGKEMGTVFFRAPIQKLAPLPLRWVLPLTRPFLSVWCLCQFLSVSLSFSNLIILLWTLSCKGLTLLAEQAGEASLRG